MRKKKEKDNVYQGCDRAYNTNKQVRRHTVIRDFLWASIFFFFISSIRASCSTGSTSLRCCKEIEY
jgi:MFS-type transporter involved in bile tolerance (Atg22 family)